MKHNYPRFPNPVGLGSNLLDKANIAPPPALDVSGSDPIKKRRYNLQLADHLNLLGNSRSRFVPGTRQSESAAISQLINSYRVRGGYVVIRGRAGQGKTTLTARLISAASSRHNKCVYHFVPLIPGAQYPLSVLRSLMTTLAHEHPYLSDLWLETTNLTSLSSSFAQMLEEISAQGDRQVIFIDGLDQIFTGINSKNKAESVLNFLPAQLPSGIVIVLTTTLEQKLDFKTPYGNYTLSRLSQVDFERILSHHKLNNLAANQISELYQALEGVPLYLKMLLEELSWLQSESLSLDALIKRLNNHPAEIFTLIIQRLKAWKTGWEKVIKPLLGLLLATEGTRPLKDQELQQLLGGSNKVPEELLKDGLHRMGSLLAQDNHGGYYLCHSELVKYLEGESVQTTAKTLKRGGIFSQSELTAYHHIIAEWCELGNGHVPGRNIWQESKTHNRWEQTRREYARQYYLYHLFHAREYAKLWQVLDWGEYGKLKLQSSFERQSYLEDLEMGRLAAARKEWGFEEGLKLLPVLWHYSLLKCSLVKQADNYTAEDFETLLRNGDFYRVVGLVEDLSDAEQKVAILKRLALHLERQDGVSKDVLWLLRRACCVARSIERGYERLVALRELASELGRLRQWGCAEEVWAEVEAGARAMHATEKRARASSELSQHLAEARHWERPEAVAPLNRLNWHRAWALSKVAAQMAKAGKWVQAEAVWAEAEAAARSIEPDWHKAWALSKVATGLAKAEQWGHAETIWKEAEIVARSIEPGWHRAWALSKVAAGLAKAEQWERAETLWNEAENVAQAIEDHANQALELGALAKSLAKLGQWEHAEKVAGTMENSPYKAETLSVLASRLAKAGKWEVSRQIWSKAEAVAHLVEDSWYQALEQSAQAEGLARAGRWEEAEAVARRIEPGYLRSSTLTQLVAALAASQHWEQARLTVHSIEDNSERAWAYKELALELVKAGEAKQVLELVQKVWLEANHRDFLIQLLPVASPLIALKPEIGPAFSEAFSWVTKFLQDPYILGKVANNVYQN